MRRQPLQFDAIYFISPTQASVDLLIKDFQHKNHYKNAHVFLCAGLPIHQTDNIMKSIANSTGLMPRLKNFAEFNMDFVPYEERVFHLGRSDLSRQILASTDVSFCIEDLSSQLTTLFATLGDEPLVYYADSPQSPAASLAAKLTAKLASSRDSLKLNSQGSNRRTHLLLVDRFFDIPAALTGSEFYQECVFDLLNVPVCEEDATRPERPMLTNIITDNAQRTTLIEERRDALKKRGTKMEDCIDLLYKVGSGEMKWREVLLTDLDPHWQAWKHLPLLDVRVKLNERIQELRDNPSARIQSATAGELNIKETGQAIRALPAYQQEVTRISSHLNIQEKLAEALKIHMSTFALFHQISTGFELKQKGASSIKADNIADLVIRQSSSVIPRDPGLQMRLALLLSVFVPNRIDDILLSFTALTNEMKSAIQTFSKRPDFKHISATAIANKNVNHSVHDAAAKLPKTTSASFFRPYIKNIILSAARGILPPSFVHANSPSHPKLDAVLQSAGSSGGANGVANKAASNANKTGSSWGFRGGAAGGIGPAKINERDRVVVFVIGGLSLSEARAAREAAAELGEKERVETVIGGTSIQVARQFLNGIMSAVTTVGPENEILIPNTINSS